MDEESQRSQLSETNLVIDVGRRKKVKMFLKTYWRTIVIIVTPLLLIPVALIGNNNAYKCFYIFLVTAVYWLGDVMHPCAISLVPIAFSTLMTTGGVSITEFFIRSCLVDCLGVMMLNIAIENSRLSRRLGLKVLLIFGCSHYRLSLLLFFFCALLSMWISNVVACGLMMPLVKGILLELEKLGILDMYHNDGKTKTKSIRHEESEPIPTDYTAFYFLGIAYSSTIGGMGTLYGSHANKTFKYTAEAMFPLGPSIEFPHFMLLNLPGVLVMETLMYMWMNFHFMGLFRAQSEIALEIGMSEEEAHYVHTLLSTQYRQLGKMKFNEWVVGSVIALSMILHISASITQGQTSIVSPTMVSTLILFLIPEKYENMKFSNIFKKRQSTSEERQPYFPVSKKACLNWPLIRNNMHWSVLFMLGSACAAFDSLRSSQMTEEFFYFLLYFKSWPAPVLALIVIIFCKVLTEFAPAPCVAYCMMPVIGRLSVASSIHPHYLMLAGILGASVPFHLMIGTAPQAMVSRYAYISPWKMMRIGVGPSIISVVVIWLTCALWTRAIWPDVDGFPQWATYYFPSEREIGS